MLTTWWKIKFWLSNVYEIVVIERLSQSARSSYYTKVTKWPKDLDNQTEYKLNNDGYMKRRLRSMNTSQLDAWISEVRALGIGVQKN